MEIYNQIAKLVKENQSFVLATIVKTEGSVPGKIGFKLLYQSTGKITGTVGGGALEKDVITECEKRWMNHISGTKEYLLTDKPLTGKNTEDITVVPMMCQGRVWIYYEVYQTSPTVYIFGGGHVGQALSYFLAKLNFRIILIDNRPEFANSERNPYAHQIVLKDYLKFCQEFQPPPQSFVVVVTHGHQFDYEIVKIIYSRQLHVNYVGVIASISKAKQLKKQLLSEMGSTFNLENLYTPIGLDLGGSTESDIALSIAAEIQAVFHNKNLVHLRQMSE